MRRYRLFICKNKTLKSFSYTINKHNMQDTLGASGKVNLSKLNLVSLVNELTYGRKQFPNPDDPNPGPPWPWSHIINKAIERVVTSLSTHSSLLSRVALNPQPLPPKAQFAMVLAEEVIERAAMMYQMADAFNDSGQERGIIIVGGFLNRFVDDICPTPPVIRFPHVGWPFPPDPDPHPEWSGLELAIIGTQFLNEARSLRQTAVQSVFHQAGEKLLQVALSRMGGY
jgi:hypothetical protein